MTAHLKQGTPEWIAMRKGHIGASDAPIIMNGIHFKRTPYSLWEEKLGLSNGAKDNSAMAYGRRNEEPARQAYEKYTGTLVFPEVVFHKEKKFMVASLDGLNGNGDLAVEIKCPGVEDHKKAQEGKVPDKYYAQVQHQLACIDINQLHYFSFRQGEGVLVEVERDEAYIERLYKEEEHFWNKVMTLEAPALTAKDFQEMEGLEEWNLVAKKWAVLSQEMKQLKVKELEYRKSLIGMAGERSAKGSGVRLTKVVSKGRVDYSAIPELEGLDLDKYRKDFVTSWLFKATGVEL